MRKIHTSAAYALYMLFVIAIGSIIYTAMPLKAGDEDFINYEIWSGKIYLNHTTAIESPTKIAAGSILYIAPSTELFVNSTLIINGTEDNPVRICLGTQNNGRWGRIFISTHGYMRARYLEIDNATDALFINGGTIVTEYLRITNIERAAIKLQNGAKGTIKYSDILDANPGIHILGANADIEGCVIRVNNADAINIEGRSHVNITSTYISAGTVGTGIYLHNGPNVYVFGTTISQCDIGIYSKNSTLITERCSIYDNNYGLYLFDSSYTVEDNIYVSVDNRTNMRYDLYAKKTIKLKVLDYKDVGYFNLTIYDVFDNVVVNKTYIHRSILHILLVVETKISNRHNEYFPYTIVVVFQNGISHITNITASENTVVIPSGITQGNPPSNESKKIQQNRKSDNIYGIQIMLSIIILIIILSLKNMRR